MKTRENITLHLFEMRFIYRVGLQEKHMTDICIEMFINDYECYGAASTNDIGAGSGTHLLILKYANDVSEKYFLYYMRYQYIHESGVFR